MDQIFVESGLFQKSRGEILGTLAHEIGHCQNRDFVEATAAAMMGELLPGFNPQPFLKLARESEFRADRRMVELLVALGEDPSPAIEASRAHEGGATHPDGNLRATAMTTYWQSLVSTT